MTVRRRAAALAAALAACPAAWSAEPAAAPPAAPAAPARESAAPAPGFDLWEIQVEGNSVLPAALIERAIAPHLGPGQGMKGLDAARNALESLYQQAGYLTVLVDIPEQAATSGVFRLVVLEGRVGSRHVLGARFHDPQRVRERVTELEPGRVPDFNRVQTQIASLNRSESRRVQPVIKPGRLPGTVDVELQVSDDLPAFGSLELNNQHAAGTTPARLSATLRYENLFQREHALTLTVQTAPADPKQSQVLALNYGVPAEEGQAWTYSLTLSNSDVATLGGAQVLGQGSTLGLRRSLVLAREAGATSFTLGVDFKDLHERLRAGSDETSTPVRYLPFSLNISDQASWGPTRLQASATLNVAWRQLLRHSVSCPLQDGSVGPQDQFACKRNGGDGSFASLKLDTRWSRSLGAAERWGQLGLHLAGQAATGALISAEQFSIGGAESVRGYFEGEASGDLGVLASLEWRGPNWAGGAKPAAVAPAAPTPETRSAFWREIRPLVFMDGGVATTLEPATGQSAQVRLRGAGLGLRLAAAPGERLQAEAGLDVAWPLTTTTNTTAHSPRLHARLALRF